MWTFRPACYQKPIRVAVVQLHASSPLPQQLFSVTPQCLSISAIFKGKTAQKERFLDHFSSVRQHKYSGQNLAALRFMARNTRTFPDQLVTRWLRAFFFFLILVFDHVCCVVQYEYLAYSSYQDISAGTLSKYDDFEEYRKFCAVFGIERPFISSQNAMNIFVQV